MRQLEKNNKLKAAFFDSGIGGLTVLHQAMKIMPDTDFIFYADEDHVPYGIKTRDEVLSYVNEAFKFMISQQVNAIVVACNTATSVAVKQMRSQYNLPIIGMEPAIKRAIDLYGSNKRVLVTATPITVSGEKIKRLIDMLGVGDVVDLLALPKLVEFGERQEFVSERVTDYLTEQFAPYDLSKFSSIVLGCTHFNYFKDTMRRLLPDNVKFVDGNAGTVNELIRQLKISQTKMNSKPHIDYYYSGRKITSDNEFNRIDIYLKRLEDVYEIK